MNSDGDGIFINLDDLNKVKTVALETFTMEKFRHMCILSGCDYLPSIKGLGLYKAHKYLRKSSNVVKVFAISMTLSNSFEILRNVMKSNKSPIALQFMRDFFPRKFKV